MLTDITASASLSISVMFDVSNTITVSASLTSNFLFDVDFYLPLFIFVISCVLLLFLSFILSII